MNKEEIVKFLDNPQTIAHLKSLDNEKEMVSYLHENGIDISLEKASELIKIFKLFEEKNGEISEEDLEGISGGVSAVEAATGIILGTIVLTAGGKFVCDVAQEYNKESGGKLTTAVDNAKLAVENTVEHIKYIGKEIKPRAKSAYKDIVKKTAKALK